jgi:hypothetical protein
VDIPSLLVNYSAEIVVFVVKDALFDCRPHVVGGLHYFSEGRLHQNGSFRFVVLEKDGASVQCPAKRGDENEIEFDICDLLAGNGCLFLSFWGNLDIEILLRPFLSEILFSVEVVWTDTLLNMAFHKVVL